MLMGGVVVQDEVQLQLGIGLFLHGFDEAEELLVPVTGQAFVDHLTGGHIQGGKEGGGSVPFVVMSDGPGPALLEREARLGTIQSLDLALFIEGEDDGPFRRCHIETDHVAELFDETRVGGELEVPDPVRLEPMGRPDAGDLAVMETHDLGHKPTAPVCPLGRFVFQGLANHFGFDLRSEGPGPARTRLVLKASETLGLVAIQPPLNSGSRDVELPAEFTAGTTLGSTQDNAGAFYLTLRSGPGTNPPLEFFSVAALQSDPSHGNRHDPNIGVGLTHGHRTFAPLH
jgi:hypothetical protein